MKSKSVLAMITVVVLATVTVISAAVVYSLNFNMSGTVPTSGSVTVTIGSTTYTTGQTLDLPWGTLAIGVNNKPITITNGMNVPVTPSISATGLPTGWTLALSSTASIAAGGSANVDIQLTVPSNAAPQTYSWTAVLNAASS